MFPFEIVQLLLIWLQRDKDPDRHLVVIIHTAVPRTVIINMTAFWIIATRW